MTASENALRLKEALERECVNVLLVDMKGESESIMPHSAMAWVIGAENSIKNDRRWQQYAQPEDVDLLQHLIKQSKFYAARGDEKEANAMNLAIGNLIAFKRNAPDHREVSKSNRNALFVEKLGGKWDGETPCTVELDTKGNAMRHWNRHISEEEIQKTTGRIVKLPF